MTTRQKLLSAILTTAAYSAVAAAPAPAPAPAQLPGGGAHARPNFVFLLTDDQRWDGLSCVQQEMGDKGRFPWIKTPNLDRLAAEGIRFRNAFVVNSLCSPSRACFLTGQYSHVNGITDNHSDFPPASITHASELRKAGYVTGYFGKWHQGKQKKRPGFDHYASFTGQGQYENHSLMVDGKMLKTKGWIDDVTTDYAIAFIKKNQGKPFDLVLGFKSPHDPRHPPARTKNLYAGETPRPTPNKNLSPIYAPGAHGGAGDENIRDEYRCIKAVDDNVGRILKALEELKLDQNTVVIFASDNGYYFGEHGAGDKRTAYEESMRIPLLVRNPRLVPAGKTMDEMVLNIDLAPTLLDLAGVKIPAAMQGRSWKPLLEGKTDNWRHAFFYAYFQENGYGAPTVFATRTDTAKLIKYPGHPEWTELFDLKNDPYETKNVANDPAAASLLKQVQDEYDRQAQAILFRIPRHADKPSANGKGDGNDKK